LHRPLALKRAEATVRATDPGAGAGSAPADELRQHMATQSTHALEPEHFMEASSVNLSRL
jgi:hypothetical protein